MSCLISASAASHRLLAVAAGRGAAGPWSRRGRRGLSDGPADGRNAGEAADAGEGPRRPSRMPLIRRLWEGRTKAELEEEEKLGEEDRAWAEEHRRHAEFLAQQRAEELDRKRNKSRLSYSDRMRLAGKPPLQGVQLETEDFHTTQEYKRHMFGLYGRAEGRLEPSLCWPTPQKMAEDREWERVFYDGIVDVKERMRLDVERKRKEAEHARKREAEIDANLKKMEGEMKQWRTRIDQRLMFAEKERLKREKILAELKQEYGYDMDPNNPHYAEKIAEKTKKYEKLEKEEKKRKRAEAAEQKRKEEEEANLRREGENAT